MAAEIRAVYTGELGLAVHLHSTGSAHACSVDHKGREADHRFYTGLPGDIRRDLQLRDLGNGVRCRIGDNLLPWRKCWRTNRFSLSSSDLLYTYGACLVLRRLCLRIQCSVGEKVSKNFRVVEGQKDDATR